MRALSVLSLFGASLLIPSVAADEIRSGKRPNILFLMSDDQDIRLGSMQYMETLQKEVIAKGANFLEHHTTSAQCCPSRVTLLRGQAAHNTNVTLVFAPGGNYEKFILSGQGKDYLPHWMKRAGYRSECKWKGHARHAVAEATFGLDIGKFLNGNNLLNWDSPPPGWDHVDIFAEPYQTTPNRVVMSENGNHPIFYEGYHQTDVVRAKALDRLEYLTDQEDPWLLFLSPTAPHVDDETGITEPCTRHNKLFPDARAPRTPNFNPPDEIQNNKAGWVRDLAPMSKANESWSDFEFRNRAQALVGIDEMLKDMLDLLEKKGELDNTYIIYTSDNGYHLGQHRMAVGKATPYVEDTNLPFVVRGPGVPQGVNSSLVSAHLDLAPTFLEIAGVDKEELPSFLDGRSLLDQWLKPDIKFMDAGEGSNREVLNVEFWGGGGVNLPGFLQPFPNNTYKTIRVVGDGIGYFYTQWCGSNSVELYNTVDDPYELKNLALDPNDESMRLMSRLNAMLMVTKSCAEMSCQNTWQALTSNSSLAGTVNTLKQALDPKYDSFFDEFPKLNIESCLLVQLATNEVPFWPAEAQFNLGLTARNQTPSLGPSYKFTPMLGNEEPQGGPEQRYTTVKEMLAKSRKLTRKELDPLQDRILR